MNLLHKTAFVKIVVLLVSVLPLILFIALYAPSRMNTEFDDSYMYSRYASNFLAGSGFSWNAADGKAYGATSPAYLVLITTLKALFSVENSLLLSLTSFAAALLGIFILVIAGYATGVSLSRWHLPFLVIPLCLFGSSYRFHSFTGMETTLAFASNAFLILSVILFSRKQGKGTYPLLLFSAIFTFQVRPDNGVYSLLFPPLYLLSSGRFTLREAIRYLILCAGAIGVVTSINYLLFGSFIPTPFYTKAGDYLTGYAGIANWNTADYLMRFLSDVTPFAALVLLLGRREKVIELLSIFIPVAITFIFFSTSTQIMGWFARYYFPSIPFIVFAAFIVVTDRMKNRLNLRLPTLIGRGSALLLYLLFAFFSPLRSRISEQWRDSHSEVNLYSSVVSYSTPSQNALENIPWWESITHVSSLVGCLPSGIIVAATEYGYIASENLDAVIVDMAGLHDRELARSGFSSQRVLARSPDMIWMPHTDYTFFRKELLEDPDFFNNYDYYMGVFNYGFAVRRASNSYNEITDALNSEFGKAYPGQNLQDFLALPVN